MSEEFGRYELLKKLGSGGMGEVFLARQKGLTGFEKLLVVKTLTPALADNEKFVAMFLDEARLAARLRHSNVCQIFDLGIESGVLFMAMEYVHGVDLAKVSAELEKLQTTFPPAIAARICSEAAGALHHAHELSDEKGRPLEIVHRDVSPANLMLTFEGGVKLCDFGLAKASRRLHQTQGRTLKGKLAYMAPEQLNGEPIDPRTDVFSLGIVLHELLTGERLFLRGSDVETIAAVVSAEIPPPSSLNPEVPPALDSIVLRALSRKPGERYPTAQSLQIALDSWLRDARDPATDVHLAKFLRQLYAERLELERTKGLLWDAPEGSVSRQLELARRSQSSQQVRPVTAPFSVPESPPPEKSSPAEEQAPPPARRRFRLWTAIALASLLTFALGVLFSRLSTKPDGPEQSHELALPEFEP